MEALRRAGAGDHELIRIIDAAMAEAARRSGSWLACRPGCTECCLGPFPITVLDARRLRLGLAELEQRDPVRAARVRERADRAVARLSPAFPGDTETGTLRKDFASDERYAEWAEDDPCPALDPATGFCDLYEARPVTCRTFGPAVRCGPGALGVCELCYHGASEEQIAACEVETDSENLEARLLDELQATTGAHGETIVAFAL